MTKKAGAAVAIALFAAIACGKGEEEAREVPQMLRTRFTGEMKTIVRDIRMAQEIAHTQEGRYFEWEELTRDYLSRSISQSYDIELTGVSSDGYTVTIVHGPSGLSCALTIGPAAASGSPTCT